jgi:hypothetical protein
MSTVGWGEVKRELLAVRDRYERRLLFAAWLSEQTDQTVMKPVVVGGHALETHTASEYVTGDLDLVVAQASHEASLLRECGFSHHERVWWNEELGLAVDLIEQRLVGDWSRLVEVKTSLGTARILGAEDILLDRLNAAVHWQIESDLLWAAAVARRQPQLDWEYLERRALEDGVAEALRAIREGVALDEEHHS